MKPLANPNTITVTQRNAKTGRLVTYQRVRPKVKPPEPKPETLFKVKSYEGSMRALIDSVDAGYRRFCARRGLDPRTGI